jgi:hypothetical protein
MAVVAVAAVAVAQGAGVEAVSEAAAELEEVREQLAPVQVEDMVAVQVEDMAAV